VTDDLANGADPAGRSRGWLRALVPEGIRVRALESAASAFGRLGYELLPRDRLALTAEETRRARLLRSLGITLVLDAGANVGGYGAQLRRLGYGSRIVSFEPLADAFAALERAATSDTRWECRRQALGSSNGTTEIHVAANAVSSSLLRINDRALRSAPQAGYVSTEQVEVTRLDSIWPELAREGDRVWLKLDVQGFELEVLKGAEASLPSIACVQAELSFVPLYHGSPLFLELIEYLAARGFRLAGLEEGHDDVRTGEMLQADGIFVRYE
jgi:FkbM family methyltransferase